ncbi:hypothetical protein DL770_005354 [Monosporascus sp. CRB-9-2]|nr:hypothetical protein DL770_005354 [Monosporascus sp. CRB-9-2]
MRFSITALLSVVAGVLAVPHQRSIIPRDLTIGDAQNICGQDMVVSCCNEVEGNDANVGGGLLGGVLQGLDLELFDQCSDLSATVAVIGGAVSDLVNDHCTQSVACCQGNEIEQSGLVNIGCLALGGLL